MTRQQNLMIGTIFSTIGLVCGAVLAIMASGGQAAFGMFLVVLNTGVLIMRFSMTTKSRKKKKPLTEAQKLKQELLR